MSKASIDRQAREHARLNREASADIVSRQRVKAKYAKPAQTMKLKHFGSVPDAVSYVTSELLATLRDDMNNGDDRESMADRVADVEAVSSLIEAAPDLLTALQDILKATEPYHQNDEHGRPWLKSARDAITKASR